MENLFHVNRGNNKCIIVFSVFLTSNTNSFTFFNSFKVFFKTSGYDFIFIKDPSNQWYNHLIEGIGKNITETIETLNKYASKYSEIICFGASMGAYAALYIGTKIINVNKIIAIAPQAFLREKWPRYNNQIHSGYYIDLGLESYDNKSIDINIIIGEHSIFDFYQAKYLSNLYNFQLTIVPNAYHNVVFLYHQWGTLDRFFKSIVGGEFDALIEGYNVAYKKNIALYDLFYDDSFFRKLEIIYFNMFYGDKKLSIKLLRSLINKFPNWYGLMRELGLLLMDDKKNHHEVIALFESIHSNNLFIDDTYRPLAKIYCEVSRYKDAISCIGSGIKRNKSNKIGYIELSGFFNNKNETELSLICNEKYNN